MRPEKTYLIEEADQHLAKSDFVFLANFDRLSVFETADLRARLEAENSEFHVVKNSILNRAAQERQLPDLREWLNGPTAIIVGGNNPAGVAKVLQKFFKDKDKLELKVGVVGNQCLTPEQIEQLAKLPGLEVLRAQLLGLLNTPAQRMVSVLSAVPRGVVQVLQAHVDKSESQS